MAKNGVKVGEMESKLLQKIEELTLYTIQQEKVIQNFRKESIQNQKRIDLLEKKMN